MRTIHLAALALSFAGAVAAQDVKIGVVGPFSGIAADYGKQMEAGMKAWLRLNGDSIAGHKVQILARDTGGPNPDVAKRLAQELVTRDKVDFLAGFGFTPNALATAPIATEAKVPMIVMNAAGSVVTTRSPYIARFSMTLQQVSAPMATWAAKNGIKKVYTLVSDFAPGIDSETAFKNTFTAAGGTIVDSVRVPLQEPRLRALRAARQGCQARSRVHVRRGRRAEHRIHEGLRGARAREGRHQADRHGRPHRRRRAAVHGRFGRRRDHEPPLLGGARFARRTRHSSPRSRKWAAAWPGPISWGWAATTAWPPSPRS